MEPVLKLLPDDDYSVKLRKKKSRLFTAGTILCLGVIAAIIAISILINEETGYRLPYRYITQPTVSTTTTTTGPTTTTTTTTTTTVLKTFNQTCNNDCIPNVGLTCTNSKCVCATTNYHWTASVGQCTVCQAGWTAYMDACFLYVSSASGYDWPTASTRCSILIPNAVLMTIEEAAKFTFMTTQYQNDFNAYANNNQAWLNSSTSTALQFSWYNGDPVNTAFWGASQPDNGGSPASSVTEGCLSISSNYNFMFSDEDCTIFSDYYCEYY